MKNQPPLKWETIGDINELTRLTKEWNTLNNAVNHSSLFNSPYWLLSWAEQYWQSEWQLNLVTVRNNGELIALAPFYIQPAKTIWGVKKLYLLGQGEPECAEIATEYSDILVAPEFKDKVLNKLAKILKSFNVDQILWKALISQSTAKEIITIISAKSSINRATGYIVNRPLWSPDKLSKNMRSRYRRGLNQLNKLEAKIDWVEKKDFEKYWQVMKEFHQNRWQNKDKTGAFCSDEFNQFHKGFRKASPKSIAMSAIWVNGVPIALHYYFVDATTLYFYQSGWDESQYSNVSPGLILHLWTIENNNKPYYDFMMGKTQGSYKAKFGTQQQAMHNITLTFSPIKVMMYRVLKKIKSILTKTN